MPNRISLPFLLMGLVLLAPMILAFVLGGISLVRHIRQRRRPHTGIIVLFSIGAGTLLASCTLALLSRYAGLHFYLFGAGWYDWSFDLMCIGIPLLCFAALLLGTKNVGSWPSILHILWMSFHLLLLLLLLAFGRTSTSYTEISSPAEVSEVHQLVFEENRWLIHESGAVYEKVSFCFMKKLGSCSSGIIYSIQQGETDRIESKFEWREDGFTIHGDGDFTYLP